jgi:predicted DNA-binding protein
MSFKDLLENWRDTAAQPRTATEYAVRLPVDDAARLAALAEMFPGRTPEQIITDLLGAALQEIETSMPYIAGKKVISNDDQGDPIFEDVGLTPRFVELTRRNRKKLETELAKNK